MEQDEKKLKTPDTTGQKGIKRMDLTPDSIMNRLFNDHRRPNILN